MEPLSLAGNLAEWHLQLKSQMNDGEESHISTADPTLVSTSLSFLICKRGELRCQLCWDF